MSTSDAGKRWRVCASAVLAIVALGRVPAFGAEACKETVCAEQGWARATPPGADTASLYFSIVNQGDADTIVSASTPVAPNAMLHRMTMTQNIARMDMVANVPLPAHGRVTFGPSGYHVMLTGLKAPLKEGASLPVTLALGSGRHLTFDIHVLGVTAMGPNATANAPGR